MKQKLQITNAFLGLMVLFSVLFQSIHTFEHVIQQFSGKICVHKYSDDATLNHSHHWEKCSVCDFAFSPTIEINSVTVSFENAVFITKPYIFQLPKIYLFSTEVPFLFADRQWFKFLDLI